MLPFDIQFLASLMAKGEKNKDILISLKLGESFKLDVRFWNALKLQDSNFRLPNLSIMHLGPLGQTFPLATFIDYLGKKTPNLMEFGLTLDPSELPHRRITLDPLFDQSQKF